MDFLSPEFAEQVGAVLPGKYSLSPCSFLSIPAGTRVLLPSPNGSALSAATGDAPTFAGRLRRRA